MTKTIYRVRSKQVRWQASFKTLAEARFHKNNAWEFRNDPTAYIEKIATITTKVVV